ncbi:hypothetical protein B0T18DRAFT_415937 [Schizothecium vesticola]|uniref:Secreted protein n=1 Tax=Schizothecium vesticola TaxID=314040 RepID=A0AA40EQS2_9PEZI|nr:hypothetical protein B0T18DRAFT_415937 [Schizothecium vesticola]
MKRMMMMTAITSFCFIVEVWSDCPALGESGYVEVLWWWERPGWLEPGCGAGRELELAVGLSSSELLELECAGGVSETAMG